MAKASIHLKNLLSLQRLLEEVIMSFFRDIQHFAGQSLSSINASARKLASSISTESNGSTSNDMTGPNIEVSEASSSASELKKRPGPLLIRSPEVLKIVFCYFRRPYFFPILGRSLNAIKSRSPFQPEKTITGYQSFIWRTKKSLW